MSRVVYDNNLLNITYKASKTPHGELFTAFEYGEELQITLFVNEELLHGNAGMEIYSDDVKETFRVEADSSSKGEYRFRLSSRALCKNRKEGLFYYSFLVGNKRISQNEYGRGYILSDPCEDFSKFQLTVYREGTNKPSKYAGGVIYQIFPDRFCKGKGAPIKENVRFNPDWANGIPEYGKTRGEQIPNNTFFGGTLYGITEKLDYLSSLGVTLLYLNPIFEASSNHRYDTGNYMKVDSMLGGEEALKELISKAKEKGIGIILDGVFNHTGDDSLYFNKYGHYPSVGAYESKDSPYYDWYFFKNSREDYESWWGVKSLPKVNSRNPKYISYITGNEGVIEKYMNLGIVGWRLDVVDELSNEFLEALRAKQKKENKEALLYGEVWEDASNKIAYNERRRYFKGGLLDGVTNYPLKNAIIAFLREGDAEFLFYTEKILYSHYPKAVSDMQMNVLSTHDTPRILTVLGGEEEGLSSMDVQAYAKLTPGKRKEALEKLKLAYLLLCTLPGMPTLYYGDEIGMEGYSDPFCRCPFKWGNEDKDLLQTVSKYLSLREKYPVLKEGYYKGVSYDEGVFVFERFDDDKTMRVIVNASPEKRFVSVEKEAYSCLEEKNIEKGIVEVAQEKAICLYF